MTRAAQTTGACVYCGRVLTRGGMTRHLASCAARTARAREAAGATGSAPESLLHLEVRDGGWGDYWLHLEMPASTKLSALDSYLRAIWLECCGHMSKFSIGCVWGGRDVGMTTRVGRAFGASRELLHVYDFGTESVSRIRLVGERQGVAAPKRPVTLMARNQPHDVRCRKCDAPATMLCLECGYDESPGVFCRRHARGHAHEDLRPIVNSPRVGLCGYDGPATPPY